MQRMMRRGKWLRCKEGGENSLEGLKNEDGQGRRKDACVVCGQQFAELNDKEVEEKLEKWRAGKQGVERR